MTHISYEELEVRLKEARERVPVGARYAHYKHPDELYVVKNHVIIEKTDTVAVIYESEQHQVPFSRPLEDFLATVVVEGKSVSRFSPC